MRGTAFACAPRRRTTSIRDVGRQERLPKITDRLAASSRCQDLVYRIAVRPDAL